MSDGIFEFEFGKGDKIARQESTRFKADAGKKYRASFAWWPEKEDGTPDWDASPRFAGAKRYYVKGKGFFIHQGPEYQQFFGKEPRKAGATVMVFWPCSKDGKVLKSELREGNFEVLAFIFDPSKYEAFFPFHEEFGFGNFDLQIHCTEAQYQKMTFSPKKDNLLRKMMEDGSESAQKHVAAIMEAVKERVAGLPNELGQSLSLDEIQRRLSGQQRGGGGGAVAPDATAGEEVDNVLDDLLDD